MLIKKSFAVAACGLMTACSNVPVNTAGAAYDGDSFYCRELAKNKYEVTGSFRGPTPSNSELYERYCEPEALWQARDPRGHESTLQMEKSFFSKFVDFILD